jgi:NAD(P)-dependent dehydrogenase (short-subunit alcohol dehydrogenase family)
MIKLFEGRRALVTGGGSGIGQACASRWRPKDASSPWTRRAQGKHPKDLLFFSPDRDQPGRRRRVPRPSGRAHRRPRRTVSTETIGAQLTALAK